MSAPPHNGTLQPGVFSRSAQTPASRPPASSRNLNASKRVCFYKSGDPQFSGHRIVINSRTFKTFDALLDALSKKVPLPFGVRTITTPKGTHAVQSLDDLQDGASYVCSDQRRVKPLNLDKVNWRQVPWNTTRPTDSGRQGRRGLIRQLVRKNEVGRTAKVGRNTVEVWTPKRLVVFKNRDPSTKHTVVLQRKTAPTFEALLDYLSQVLQFPVVKLYTADGRRVEGLPALILCSGVVVAAGNESFRLCNYNLQGSSQPSQSELSESTTPAETQRLQHINKSPGSRSRSRNFSLSSERYLVNQINKSLNGSLSGDNGQKTGSMDTENNQPLEMETSDCIADMEDKDHFVMPSEDDIEKSFRVNQDGSMTVEMRVRLTIKQEEMIHWTTTLSRTCAVSQQRAVCSQLGYNTSDNNNCPVIEAQRDSYESKEDNTPTEKSEGLNNKVEVHCGSTSSETLEKPKPAFRRLPTPGPRRVRRKEASVENLKRVSQIEVQESTVGSYSYMERTAEGELTEGFCVVSRSSSSSTRPVPKPRKSSSGEAKPKKSNSSFRSSRMAEVLQLQNSGTEIKETVMHIYETQGMHENYFPNTQVTGTKRSGFRAKTKEQRKTDSTDSGPRSSSNDCDIDLTRHSTSSGTQNARKNELLSLSSGQSSPSQQITNNLAPCTNTEKQAKPESSHKTLEDLETCTKENSVDKGIKNRKSKMTPQSVKSKAGTSSDTTMSDKKKKGKVPGSLKDLKKSNSPESQSHTGSEKKAASSAESDKHGQKVKKKKKDKVDGFQKHKSQVNVSDNKEPSEMDFNLDNGTTPKSPKKINRRDGDPARDSSQNVNAGQIDSLRAPMKKTLLDVLPPTHFKMLAKQRSTNECRVKSPKESRELSESISMPVLQSTPSSVHQYVESWLKKIQPESVPYVNEMDPHEKEPEARAEFWIGSGSGDSSEVRSESERDAIVKECLSLEDTTAVRPVSRPPVEIRCEGEPVETQRIRGFCKSMPSVRIHPAEHGNLMRMNKSSEALAPVQPDVESEASQSTKVNTKSGMTPVLKQLCLSIQSIRRTSSHSHLTSMEKEKSSSLPDFSSQVASVFGSPSKAFLSFLSVMTLKDDISSTGNEDQVSNSGSCSEALQVMQSLEKIASIEDENELKASLTSLKSSTSSQLKKSWRDFQERNDAEESPPLSPRQSEQEFALEVDSEEEEQDKEHCFGIEQLMDELNMSEDLRREISSLVDGTKTNSNEEQLTSKHSSHSSETTEIASESENATKEDFLEKEGGCSKERESQDDNRVESCPLEQTPSKDLTMDNLDVKNVQPVEDETSQTDLLKLVPDTGDNPQTIAEMYADNGSHHTENNVKENNKEQDEQFKCEYGEADLHTHTSETERTELSEQHSDLNDAQGRETKKGDDTKAELDERHINAEEEDTYQETSEYTEHAQDEHGMFINKEQNELYENREAEHQNKMVIQEEDFGEDAKSQHQESGIENCDSDSQNSHDLEARIEKLVTESPRDEHDRDISIREETENIEELEDARSDASECNVNDADPDTNDNGPMEEQDDKDRGAIASEYKDPDKESHHSFMSDQKGGQSDGTKTGSCKSPESENEHELKALDKGIIEKQISSAEEEDEEEAEEHEDKQSNASDSEKDFDTEPETNYPAMSDQDGEHHHQKKSGSCKSQQSEGEHDSEILEMESVDEDKDEEAEEHKDKQSNTLDSDKDFDAESNSVVSDEDGEHSYKDKTESWRCQESEAEHEFQKTEEEKVAEEKEEEIEEHEDDQSNALDSDKDFDAESSPAVSDEDGEHSDNDKTESWRCQESEAEHEFQTTEEEKVIEEKDEEDEDEDQSNALDSDEGFDAEPEPNDSGEHSDQNRSGSCKSPESEGEHDFQEIEEEGVIEKCFTSAEEKDEEVEEHENKQSKALDSAKDFGTEPDYSEKSDQDCEHSDQDNMQSCKSYQSEAESEFQTLHEESVIEENDREVDEYEDKQSSALDSDKDFNLKPDLSAVSDQDGELSDQSEIWSCKSKESKAEYELQTKNIIEKKVSSPEEIYDEADGHLGKQSNSFPTYIEADAQSNHSSIPDPETKHTKRRDTFNSQDTEANTAHSEETEGVEEDDRGSLCAHPMDISQELLDFVNLALLSSALTFTYDSNGHLRIEPDRGKIREMSLADSQHVQRRLPSPSTSDLSDYRPETSDSGGDLSQGSTDLFTETGEEEIERLSICQGSGSSKKFKRHDKVLENGSMETKAVTKQIASSSLKSINSPASLHDSMANGVIQEPEYSRTSSSFNEDSEPVQNIGFHSEVDHSEGILIDKGRWLLKENHLIRKSPPVPIGMYENADTTSVDTGQDNTSEDAPHSPCVIQHSPLAAISSSELEEMAKPATPKCTYFNMPHSSDSDPFLDNQSVNSSKVRRNIQKSRELRVSPMGEPSKTWAKKNGSLPSFASVEFKMPDGKVHPEGGPSSAVVEKNAVSQSISGRVAQEEESVEGLNLRCGRHCPIL